MMTKNCYHSLKSNQIFALAFVIAMFLCDPANVLSPNNTIFASSKIPIFNSSHIIYQNSRVYNVQISFEIHPDLSKIDREDDLKVWVPIPRQWDSQKNVRILSVQPEPHSEYIDPEFGNKIFFWDFGKYPAKSSYQIKITARLLSYEVQAKIDTSRIKPYDRTTEEYKLYTESRFTINLSSSSTGFIVG